ncbi:kelch domain-containing protein 10 [Trichonephila inaurata madagascariensis]|uniref:Kelch domain-containing protein 10 n=1 Tax=Trichonephila inaurata madagascariensis TaxID=2747483 RepID=A0A8X7BSK1_9ARAC|nr:kelch domain-containing protein 10 [Trichonephila inaurata madagascariensis]
MEFLKDSYRQIKRRSKVTYKFRTNKLVKLLPTGNRIKGIDLPKPRSGHRIVATGSDVYTFGGYTPVRFGPVLNHVIFKELWKYNIASRTWKLLETSGKMPETLASHCAALVGNNMVVFGGTGIPFGETSSNSTHICNLDTLEWTTLKTTGTPPIEQYGQAMLVHENKMYIVGGTTGFAYSIDVHCLDLVTKEWKALEKKGNRLPTDWEPQPRYRLEISIYDNKIFVFGGGTALESFDFKEVPVFDIETCSWSKISTTLACPEPRRCHGCAQIDDNAYICGGFDGSKTFSDVWKFNLKTFQWTKMSITLPTPIYFHSVAVSEAGQFYIFGGVDSIVANTRTNNLLSVWLKIPSLAEISWQALMLFMPHISRTEKAKLYEAGVPFQFLKRIDFDSSDSNTIARFGSNHSES